MPSSVFFMYTERRFWPVIESMLRKKLILASSPCQRSMQRHLNIISYYIVNHCSWDYWHLISFQWFCSVGCSSWEKEKEKMYKANSNGQMQHTCVKAKECIDWNVLTMKTIANWKYCWCFQGIGKNCSTPTNEKRPPTSAQTLFNVLEIIFLLKVTLIFVMGTYP